MGRLAPSFLCVGVSLMRGPLATGWRGVACNESYMGGPLPIPSTALCLRCQQNIRRVDFCDPGRLARVRDFSISEKGARNAKNFLIELTPACMQL